MALLNAKREMIITVSMDEEIAVKIGRALTRLLTAVDHLSDPRMRTELVNDGTIDAAVALRTAISDQMPS